jgi:hypothetical protein
MSRASTHDINTDIHLAAEGKQLSTLTMMVLRLAVVTLSFFYESRPTLTAHSN